MSDERASHLAEIVAVLCNVRNRETVVAQCAAAREVSDFLDNFNVQSLVVSSNSDGLQFSVHAGSADAAAATGDSNGLKIVLSKRSNAPVTVENISETIDVRSIQPTSSEDTNIAGVKVPSDEYDFWSRRKGGGGGRRKEASDFAEDIARKYAKFKEFDRINELKWDEVADLLEDCKVVVKEVWGSYQDKVPLVRMDHLLRCITGSLYGYVQANLLSLQSGVGTAISDVSDGSTVDKLSTIWTSPVVDVQTAVASAVRLLEKWRAYAADLSSSWHARGEVDDRSDPFLKGFINRLQDIVMIRVCVHEFSYLLRDHAGDFQQQFADLDAAQPFLYSDATETKWDRAMKQFDRRIDPLESEIVERLKRQLNPLLDRPQLLLIEFQRYANLLLRPKISQGLAMERETLLSLLKDMVRKLDQAVDKLEDAEHTSDDSPSASVQRTLLLSPRVAGIVFIRQIRSKVKEISTTVDQISLKMGGSGGSSRGLAEDIAADCVALRRKLEKEEKDRFREWESDTKRKIEDSDSPLHLKGNLLDWKGGSLVVNFSEELVRFIREVRQMDELGLLEAPASTRASKKGEKGIVDKALEAEKYYRYGMLLKKTANSYNSLSEQMKDVQEQLLLKSLSHFVDVVTPNSSGRGGDVTWGNQADCEAYVINVQKAAEQLSNENRRLRKVHEQLCHSTVQLMGIELQRQAEKWREGWRGIKDFMDSVRVRYEEKDARLWVRHWDHQIYKALEASYQMGLESLNENLQEMKAELVFVNKRLELKPPLEQLRQSYYNEMKRFIGMPNTFEGFGNVDVYRLMCSRNAKRLRRVYKKAESLFEKLGSLTKRYSGLVKLAQVDLDQYIEAHVKHSDDYVANFKAVKAKKKDFDKLPDFEKIDCYTISLIPLKSFLDEFLNQVQDALLVSLRRGLLDEFKEVDQFLETSSERLSSRPHSVEEIGSAKKQWKEIDSKKDSIKAISKACMEKKKLLLHYAPGSTVDISEVIARMSNLDGEGGRWDDFDIASEAFNDMIEEQKEALKSSLEEEVVNLNSGIDKFGNRWRQLKPGDDMKSWEAAEIQKIFTSLDDWKKQLSDLQANADKLTESCLTFSMNKPRFDGLEALVEDISVTMKSWDLLKAYFDELKTISDQDWLTFSVNVYVLQDFAAKWVEELKANYSKGSYDSVGDHIFTTVERIKKSVPALKYCRGEPFKEDHWSELLQGKLQLGREVHKENVKVEHFLSRLDILMEPSTLTFVKNLQARALGEVQIREALQELRTWERNAEVQLLLPSESGRRIPLVKDWKDMFVEMGDKQSLLASLKESQFFKAFADQGLALEVKMTTLDTVLQTLNSIQRKWVYLEPIFGRGALPSEESRFRRVDDEFSDIMNRVSREPKLFYLADEQIFPRLTDNCKEMLDALERCQKALTDFLEAKRSAMPRFYFIGDDDLLEILGQAKNPAVIQSHLKKLFQGIHKVQFNQDSTKITSMISSANEVVKLESPVPINEKVEEWLHLLAAEMRVTLSSSLEKCLGIKEIDWSFPAQILCLAQSIRFTEEAEQAIQDGPSAIDGLRKQLEGLLRGLTSHDLSSEPLTQLKMKSLVFDLVHQIDVVDQIRKQRVSSTTDWHWRKQLRYYMRDGKTTIEMHDAVFNYTFEYQGNAPRLVHTPLTDKCYLTLTQGMRMGFGGNPYGPAGTGKTESVKALAQCMGRQVLVFNCDEALESTSMIRIFIGIVKCGAWGCFDEFNRLKEDQLSAISQQIQIIQDSIKNRVSPISLLNRSVDVDFNSGIFVTLNPAGKGYGGRSRLPDNLKALFRPVAMGAPDNELIADVSLVTEGFTQSKDLASKIVSLFKLSRQLLSPQQHYDWGLRALKAVLNSGGRLIQMYKAEGKNVDATMEYEILIKAVRVNTLSKLTYADTVKFLALIGDVFPGVTSADISGGELEDAIKEVMKDKFHLVEDASQIKKMIQLKESLDQRMGCVIVGPSGCGKSSLWHVLQAALKKCGQPVLSFVMNPKSMPRERLLGYMDIDTREWSDGVLTDAARKVVREPNEVKCWIICDGDVDPEWIESLNSVLDDNHLLTLPNGERINFGPNVNFLFETHDLKFASPATISRMGMIFLSDEDLDVKRLVQKWMWTLPQEKSLVMSSWIDELFYKALEFVLANDCVLDTTLVGTVMNGLAQVKEANTRHEFIVALIRGIGGNLSVTHRTALAKEIFKWAAERQPDSPLDYYASGSTFVPYSPPAEARDKDVVDIREIGQSVVIPTVSVQRTLATMDSWIKNLEPFILVGPEGCGKSMIIHHAFKQRRNIGITTLHCNAQTSADDIINKISQTCSLFSAPEGRVYRPRDCERLVLYLKDINLPRPDMYDTCQLIAFLQQMITFGGFYDENLEFLRLERIQIVASINAATTVGRHALSTRFTAVVRILVVDYPETSELVAVYDAFLASVLNSVALADRKWCQPSERQRLANAMVEVYKNTREKFTVDDRRHYLFTPRDITTWVKNICRYDLASEDLVEAFVHEANRIFRDRLVGNDAVNKFDQQLLATARTQFRYAAKSSDDFYFTSLTSARGGGSTAKKGESKEGDGIGGATVDFMGGQISRMSETEFKKLVAQGVMYYEREEKDLNMLLFPEILDHIAHIDRTLSTYGGHILLAGRSGVGRRNAATLAAYMLGYEVFTPLISRDYKSKQFLGDCKTVLHTAGVKGEHVVLLIEDFQIVTESILEIVNSLLSSGEVPGMYTHEELEPLLSPLREKMREEGTFRTPYEYFVSRIRKYLHIVICMDPGHPQFLYRCESNPALYSQCAVMWLGEWKTATLKTIPTLMEGIKDLIAPEEEDGEAESEALTARQERKGGESKSSRSESKSNRGEGGRVSQHANNNSNNGQLLEMVLAIHQSCTVLNAAPRDYLIFLQTWYQLCTDKRKELSRELGHLEAGLSKLESAATVVNDLRTNAVQQEKDLRIAQAAADRAMDEISKALSSATERRHEVGEVKRTVAENEEKTHIRKKEIEDELSEIQPILDSAKQAVGQIKSDHLNEIRSLTAPPEAIADVLAAVLMMLGVQDLSWLSMKKFLSNRGVKDDILNYDAKKISPELRKNVAKLIKKKSTSFEDETIRRVSVAAAPMAAWVKANIRYSMVIEKIEPLQVELQEEELKLEESEKRLKRCEEELAEIDSRVTLLKKEFGERTGEAERLKRNLSIAGSTLDKAEGLIGQLSGEQARWKTQAGQLRADLAKLPMKMLLAAGFSTYLAKASEDIRESMIAKWKEITGVPSFSFKRVMSTESELLQWKNEMSLPSDDLSQENSLVIVHATNRVPFIIDPASAATDWLKAFLAKDRSRPLEVVTHHDARFSNQVELAVRFGKTLLILEVDGVEPMLYPLCRKDLCHQGPRFVVSIGDKVIDYNENFRMFLVTRNPSPDVPPDAASLVTQVNFTVTKSGLEGQLLGLAIFHEQPELEKAKGEMLKKEEDFKVQLAGLEKNLLEALATAEGNLLENTSLIESLTMTKEKAAEIEDALQKSAEASIRLNEQREVYRPFAHSGAKLFFLVKGLQSVNHMYQFSLASFLGLFRAALEAEMDARGVEDRLSKLCSDIEVRVLYFVGRAIFKADRLMLALHLIKGMHADHFQPKEWDILTGSLVASVSEGLPRGYPSWAPAERQDAFRLLSEHLPHLINSLELTNGSKWQRFSTAVEAEKDLPVLKGISPFQRVMIIQAFRPDRLQTALIQFCTDLLRIDSISPPPLSLAHMYTESSPQIPLLLISSPGADPSKELQEYAAKTIGAANYDELAMGGGQQEVAMRLLRSAAEHGTWLCLKNLHLVIAWLPSLEKELSSLEAHPNFRLWLTSESHSMFPSILLQQSLKATYESPPGIKKNLQRTFESWDESSFEPQNPVRSRLLFLLAAFHSVLQERRNYIPQGWTKFYEFSYGDLKAGNYVIEAATASAQTNIDWEAIHGLMEDAIYGGRIDNAFDVRVLKAYLQEFFTADFVSEARTDRSVIAGTSLNMPKDPEYHQFKKAISRLNDTDVPAMFSLPDNIERSLQRNLSAAVIKQLRALSTVDAEGSKYDREKWRAQLNPVIELWQQLSSTSGVVTKKARELSGPAAAATKKVQDPVDDFVGMEYELAGDLCNMIDASLNALKKVLFGSGLLTPVIQAIATSLLSGAVPGEWLKRWDRGPEKPQAWLRELVRKRVALAKWRSNSSRGSLLGEPLTLGDLFNPATFINALRQQTARQLGTAIDRVKMISSWEKDGKQLRQVCPQPCTLANLLMQGAAFQTGFLEEPAPTASEIVPAPQVHIGFVAMDTRDVGASADSVSVPIYLTPTREEFLVELSMPIKGDHNFWVLSGVSLFLSEDE